ncbi:response regulator [Elstera cyanobacteriorum]|uniref:response regulator n=1 Tax=Elstera cyanobacteriorum TaxID=2022747 RepID=UPI0023579357|nr:response regulator transcription factor [Elstera cyanobacteriorum]MCK6444027.1 response regulator transcription factor [Elstera cyanobacteriorum]
MERARHLLVVDDDREIQALLHDFLVKHGFRVSTAGDGRDVRRQMAQWTIDLVILDLMLPGESGVELCRALRAESDVPIIMLTAVAEEAERIICLEIGADDYIVKPFSPRELLARIRALFRRTGGRDLPTPEAAVAGEWEFSGWRLDTGKRELRSPDGVLVHLSAGEYQLLTAFLERPQRVVTREELMDIYKGDALAPFDRSIDIQISRLRRKIEQSSRDPTLIKTVRGAGYQFTVPVTRPS